MKKQTVIEEDLSPTDAMQRVQDIIQARVQTDKKTGKHTLTFDPAGAVHLLRGDHREKILISNARLGVHVEMTSPTLDANKLSELAMQRFKNINKVKQPVQPIPRMCY